MTAASAQRLLAEGAACAVVLMACAGLVEVSAHRVLRRLPPMALHLLALAVLAASAARGFHR